MKIGILGTGIVGRTLGGGLVKIGHDVRLGGRSSDNAAGAAWVQEQGAHATFGTFAEAAGFGELLFNCTQGGASLEACAAAGAANLADKPLVDVANPLDLNEGHFGELLFCNTTSLGERIQAAYPQARVVKALNTMWCGMMVNPRQIPGPHNVFVCGNDAAAKTALAGLLRGFGWRDEDIVDLGDIHAARATEMLLPLWMRLYQSRGGPAFNFHLAAAAK